VLASCHHLDRCLSGYALDLDGERPDPFAAPGTVEEREGKLCLPLQRFAGSTQSWLERIPVLEQGLVQGISAGTASTGYAPQSQRDLFPLPGWTDWAAQ
jgi:hypothetical protein